MLFLSRKNQTLLSWHFVRKTNMSVKNYLGVSPCPAFGNLTALRAEILLECYLCQTFLRDGTTNHILSCAGPMVLVFTIISGVGLISSPQSPPPGSSYGPLASCTKKAEAQNTKLLPESKSYLHVDSSWDADLSPDKGNLVGRFQAQTISRRGSSHYDALTVKDLAAQLLFTQLNATASQLFEIAGTWSMQIKAMHLIILRNIMDRTQPPLTSLLHLKINSFQLIQLQLLYFQIFLVFKTIIKVHCLLCF